MNRSKPFIDDEPAPMLSNAWIVKIVCNQIRTEALDQQHSMAEALWNWIDNLPATELQPEPLWRILAAKFPELFRDPADVNSFIPAA